jgi:hypothetical protein
MFANCPPPDCPLNCCDLQGKCPISPADCYIDSLDILADTTVSSSNFALDTGTIISIVFFVVTFIGYIVVTILIVRRAQRRRRENEQMRLDLLRHQIAYNNQGLPLGGSFPGYQPPPYQSQGQYFPPQSNFI